MFHTDLAPFGVDMERLTKDRLSRLQSAMKRERLGALLLTDFLNLRYATNTVMMLGLRATGIQRFALVPAEGAPLICQREHVDQFVDALDVLLARGIVSIVKDFVKSQVG